MNTVYIFFPKLFTLKGQTGYYWKGVILQYPTLFLWVWNRLNWYNQMWYKYYCQIFKSVKNIITKRSNIITPFLSLSTSTYSDLWRLSHSLFLHNKAITDFINPAKTHQKTTPSNPRSHQIMLCWLLSS